MDCPSEENLIRMALADEPVTSLRFDLPNRTLYITHSADPADLLARLSPLNLGASVKETRVVGEGSSGYQQTVFSIPKMDCPSEENLIRMALQEYGDSVRLSFDLKSRQLQVVHQVPASEILAKLSPLNLGASITQTTMADSGPVSATAAPDDTGEARTLRLLLAINGAMFAVEMILGLMAQSAGLVADSLDMFADAAVYGLSLYAVGGAAHMKVRAAHIAGWLQMILAVGALVEVIRRFTFGSEPESDLMMGIGVLALIANVSCLVLISQKRNHGVHMKASYIFSANDVLANIGVIVAGLLVHWTHSSYPDLIIGTFIALIVMRGAQRILKLS
ncbi:cation transporter [Oxalicibacterium solurbis]|uniref:Sodium:proton antiporter n=1 Tax=Oxalicibacterium solurbis TaxID=69280 RepID=A0A8J3AY32_9BURK|nr:sodium:proton antiporter [Oxalicibacterium solurbis]